MAERGPNFNRFVLNCVGSRGADSDWTFGDAVIAQAEVANIGRIPLHLSGAELSAPPPASKDLRRPWWEIRNQGRTGACVGFAAADVLRWHYTLNDMMQETERPSPRFLWMANKETDDITRYPTTFIESAGTSTKLSLSIAQKYGCVPERMLPITGQLSNLPVSVFFSIAAQFRITAYYNLGKNLNEWRSWIAHVGPVLTRLEVDLTWKNATATDGELEAYQAPTQAMGGHAVCLVGYTPDYFIVRNSWGATWGDAGFAYASNQYAESAFTEAYGALL